MANKENKYVEFTDNIIGLMGGKDNITYFAHCVTRLRLSVKDKGLIDEQQIKNFSCVMGTQWVGEQYQIIIGQSVAKVYTSICQKHNMGKEDEVKETVKDDIKKEKEKFSLKGLISNGLSTVAACIVPILPVIAGAGMLKVFVLIAVNFNIISNESPTAQVITFVADASFYFLPIFIGWASAKKFGASPVMGLLIGAMLVHPAFVTMVQSGAPLSVFGLPITPGTYSNSIFPAILAGYVLSKVEKPLNRWIPDMLKSVFVPVATLLIMVPITFVVIAPLGGIMGEYLAIAVNWIYVTFGSVGIAINSTLQPIMIMTGMHVAMIPYGLTQYSTLGYLPLVIGVLINNFNQGSASLAVGVKTKNKNLKATAFSVSFTALIAGITEPAMFGVTIPLKKPIYCIMAGNFCGALYAGMMGVHSYVMGGTNGIFAFPAYMPGGTMMIVHAIIGCVIGFIVTFVLTYITHKDKIESAN